jgi:hypothetical protein
MAFACVAFLRAGVTRGGFGDAEVVARGAILGAATLELPLVGAMTLSVMPAAGAGRRERSTGAESKSTLSGKLAGLRTSAGTV